MDHSYPAARASLSCRAARSFSGAGPPQERPDQTRTATLLGAAIAISGEWDSLIVAG